MFSKIISNQIHILITFTHYHILKPMVSSVVVSSNSRPQKACERNCCRPHFDIDLVCSFADV